ncbi:cytochrome C biogenesis protein [Bacillus sp. FJAT-27264]|uniref:peroxiredoxin family protein n=1 Tax=Paenibacillus sp. (strain DSM 101736 / FJAT-27264) TaxID=1850362 RepID=UPI000807F896|nr:TlpA family protein disulfide reductase [Bacillus sp. FJAT-27264]OBZ18492.1 cytochrome C biogenesis protein [Bacillus sp. FJAT-27264]
MKKNVIAIIFIIGLVLYGGYEYFNKSSQQPLQSVSSEVENRDIGIEIGQVAPDFSLQDLSGNPVQLSDFRGKRVMLNFWATWCPPCRVEMPHMQSIYENYESEDVVILGVNMTLTEKRLEDVSPFVQEQKLTFPIVLDEDGELMQTYQIVAYPTTYVLDADGVVREKVRGAMNYEMMSELLAEVK